MSAHSLRSSVENDENDYIEMSQIDEITLRNDLTLTANAETGNTASSSSTRVSHSEESMRQDDMHGFEDNNRLSLPDAHYLLSPDDQLSTRSERSHPVEPRFFKRSRLETLKDIWAWEVLSLFLSLASVFAIAVTLAILDGKALSWWKMPIKPNALISVFATISKSSLLLPTSECISQAKWIHFAKRKHCVKDLQTFDDASRGPFGSLIFLWQFRTRGKTWIASLACLITTVALVADPFAQQIIDYPVRIVAAEGSKNAATSITRIYQLDSPSSLVFDSSSRCRCIITLS